MVVILRLLCGSYLAITLWLLSCDYSVIVKFSVTLVYSRTSMARTPMVVYHGLFELIFESLRNFFRQLKNTYIEGNFLILL